MAELRDWSGSIIRCTHCTPTTAGHAAHCPHVSQNWFWTPRWQQMEREADEDLKIGRFKEFDTMEAFIADLDAE